MISVKYILFFILVYSANISISCADTFKGIEIPEYYSDELKKALQETPEKIYKDENNYGLWLYCNISAINDVIKIAKKEADKISPHDEWKFFSLIYKYGGIYQISIKAQDHCNKILKEQGKQIDSEKFEFDKYRKTYKSFIRLFFNGIDEYYLEHLKKKEVANKIIKQTDTYQALRCEAVKDNDTDLTWFVGPDRNMTWSEARHWTKKLKACGDKWRMPTISEIRTLYKPSMTAGTGHLAGGKHWPAHMHSFFSNIGGGSWIWSNEQTSRKKARSFNMNQGKTVIYDKNNRSYSTRAFAVKVSH